MTKNDQNDHLRSNFDKRWLKIVKMTKIDQNDQIDQKWSEMVKMTKNGQLIQNDQKCWNWSDTKMTKNDQNGETNEVDQNHQKITKLIKLTKNDLTNRNHWLKVWTLFFKSNESSVTVIMTFSVSKWTILRS